MCETCPCQNCEQKSKCGKENVTLTFQQGAELVISAFDEKPLEDAMQILNGAAQLLEQNFPKGESAQLSDAKNFYRYFSEKKVVEQW